MATTSEGTIAQGLASYVTRMRYGDLPSDVIAKAKLCILDTLGAMLAGTRNDVGVRITEHAVTFGSDGPCTVFGRGRRVGVEHAALANGTLGHVLELDDGHRPSDNHLGCVVVPAAIAMAQVAGSSGTDLLLSVVLGYDVMGRVGEAVCLPRLQTPFHGSGTTGVFGSAAVAGRAMSLAPDALANAFGIAGTAAAGLREVFESGTDCKSLHIGRATQNGITAALLAGAGYCGPAEILEGRYGFCVAMTSEPHPELILKDLGERFAVIESSFKVHAVCGLLFTAIDGALHLRREQRIDPRSIERVRVALPGWVRTDPVFTKRRPPTIGQARFSVPFGVAAALVDGEVSPRQIAREKLTDPTIAAVEERIEITADAEVEALFEATKAQPFFFYPSLVEIEAGGRTHRRLERTPVGYDPARGLTQAEVVAKFHALADDAVGADRASRIADIVGDLDRLTDTSDLHELLGAANARQRTAITV